MKGAQVFCLVLFLTFSLSGFSYPTLKTHTLYEAMFSKKEGLDFVTGRIKKLEIQLMSMRVPNSNPKDPNLHYVAQAKFVYESQLRDVTIRPEIQVLKGRKVYRSRVLDLNSVKGDYTLEIAKLRLIAPEDGPYTERDLKEKGRRLFDLKAVMQYRIFGSDEELVSESFVLRQK